MKHLLLLIGLFSFGSLRAQTPLITQTPTAVVTPGCGVSGVVLPLIQETDNEGRNYSRQPMGPLKSAGSQDSAFSSGLIQTPEDWQAYYETKTPPVPPVDLSTYSILVLTYPPRQSFGCKFLRAS